MLSRHFLRSKVLQTLYAHEMEPEDQISTLRNFEYHMSRLNELGILQVSLMTAMVETAAKVIEESKKKFRPTEEERSPNTKFLHNEYLRRMADNFELRQAAERYSGVWETHEDLVREAFIEFRRTKTYTDYLASSANNFATDKELAIMLFRFLMNREALVSVLAERSLLWEDDFEQIAQYNFMMLKTLGEEDFTEAMPWPLMYDKRAEKDEADMDFARTVLRASLELRQESDELIRQRLQGWEFDRIALMDILIINMAVAELQSCPTIPERVTVDEYIELSKEFSTERSRLFVNGILEKMVLELRHQGKIKKTGRGLNEPEDTAEETNEQQ